MGRELKRVPLDFSWPAELVWKGYINPYHSQECKVCEGSGYNPATRQIADDWYDFEQNGRKWCYNIVQDEVDALIEHGRLMDFTHTWNPEEKWKLIDPPPVITAKQVNEWSRHGLGHDAINRCICVEARAKRLGVWGDCPVCEGHGEIWFNEKIRELSENWYENEKYDPPTGEGWQVWETVSEGSPISPVFETPEELVTWLVGQGYSRAAAEGFVKVGNVPSMVYTPKTGLVSDIETAGIE
jgi:hypothetical protein